MNQWAIRSYRVTTPSELLREGLRRDGARPLITWYDDATGERVELSVATTANWVAKTANFLVDELDVEPGDTVDVLLPLHWQTAIVLLAVWAVGGVVSFDPTGAVSFVHGGGGGGSGSSSGSSSAGGSQGGDDGLTGDDRTVVLTFAPMGADFSRLVASQPDDFVGYDESGADVVEAATRPDVPHGARVLTTLPLDDADGLALGLITPLATDGSVVMVSHPDAAKLPDRCAAEQVTRTCGLDVPGLPRLP